MTRTIRAVFDGKVLRPEEPVDLKPDTRYRVTVEDEDELPRAQGLAGSYPLTTIRSLATDMGVVDLSDRHHRRYLPGAPGDDSTDG